MAYKSKQVSVPFDRSQRIIEDKGGIVMVPYTGNYMLDLVRTMTRNQHVEGGRGGAE